MPDTDSITLVKQFAYRDNPLEEWSNTYHLTGTTPTDDASWEALATAIWNSERHIIRSSTRLLRAYGYVAGGEHSVSTVDYSTRPVGTAWGGTNAVAGDKAAGDQAQWVRAKIGRSSTGKTVYIRKYYHDVPVFPGGGDQVPTDQQGILVAHATLMLGGTLPGGMKWCGPQEQEATLPVASKYTTTRTLKRRGKRP